MWGTSRRAVFQGFGLLRFRSYAQVAALRAALGSVVEDTVGNVEKKQARTYEELQAEQAEADEARPPLRTIMTCFFLTWACYQCPLCS